jgi:hypothetical protein
MLESTNNGERCDMQKKKSHELQNNNKEEKKGKQINKQAQNHYRN